MSFIGWLTLLHKMIIDFLHVARNDKLGMQFDNVRGNECGSSMNTHTESIQCSTRN